MITGDFAKLTAWSGRIAGLSNMPSEAAQTVAPLFTADVQAAINGGTTIDGTALPPDTAEAIRRGSVGPLRRSGNLVASAIAAARAGAIAVSFGVDYLRFQVARGRSPFSSSLPAQWADQIRAAASDAFAKRLRG